jgi:hypothetical protein
MVTAVPAMVRTMASTIFRGRRADAPRKNVRPPCKAEMRIWHERMRVPLRGCKISVGRRLISGPQDAPERAAGARL